ncbi:hypothetical protein [Halorubrum distributum]|uniref:hypothetical protein n=1 Tax=Halorubrum distributum TaxID=29283 RepID=UPI0009B5BB15|nr:hypothetical protein [Halorubrum terrestre]
MKRRRIITAFGGFAGTSSILVGSGAFNFANVERTISVSVADDRNAFLKLTQRGSGERSELDGNPDTLEFSIPGDDGDNYPSGNPTDPEGVGPNSVYKFGRDAANDEIGLFAITNLGTDPVNIYSTQPTTSGVPSVTIFDANTGDLLTESSPSSPLGVGEHLACGLQIDTRGVTVQEDEYEVPIVINAKSTTV